MFLMNNMSLTNNLLRIMEMIPAIILAFSFHEFAHAKVADMLGDKTPRFQGRLTLNPASHLDPLGTLLIFLVGFGWAKPVETNPRAYKNYYKDDLKVSIAGPLANLILSFIGALLYEVFPVFQNMLPESLYNVLSPMIFYIFYYNAALFVFNLLPVPGLDGFWVLRDLNPKFFNSISDSLYRYQMIIIAIIAFAGGPILSIPISLVRNFILTIAQLIIGLL